MIYKGTGTIHLIKSSRNIYKNCDGNNNDILLLELTDVLCNGSLNSLSVSTIDDIHLFAVLEIMEGWD